MVTAALQEALNQHANLRAVLERYPAQAAPLSQTLVDLTHASKWSHLSVVDTLPDGETNSHAELGRALVVGLRPEANALEAVWCCTISDMLSSAIFQNIFAALDGLALTAKDGDREVPLQRTHFLLAVHSPDATVVYYNMARGLVKPVN